MSEARYLQDEFVASMGQPLPFGDDHIVQADRWTLDAPAVVEVRFLGPNVFVGQSARLSVNKPGRIQLSDNSYKRVVAVEDHASLPRFARHRVEPRGSDLLIYNAYRVDRSGLILDESWTGNAGMIVTPIGPHQRRYECSHGSGPFERTNLLFEVTILPGDAPWRPEEIYG